MGGRTTPEGAGGLTADPRSSVLDPWIQFVIALAVAVVVAVVFTAVAALVVRGISRRRDWGRHLIAHVRRPFRVFALVLAVWIALAFLPDADGSWTAVLRHVLSIVAIGVAAWLLAGLVLFGTELMLGRYRVDVPDNRVARRIRSQVLIIRRLAMAVIVVIALGAVLLTFESVRAVGASLLASAGIASVVAGLAAQSVLGNVFAGLQLVFSDALRVDDVVVVEDEWGRIGEITLTYVVVDLWDERRLVLPCTYFTTQPFANWTRKGSELLGAVELDLDWRISPARMREHLERVVAGSELWDGRTSVLQVTEAVGGLVRVRILVSAADAGKLFDLRCVVREAMVTWMQRTLPESLPVQRVLVSDHDTRSAPEESHARTEGLFSGSAEAEKRAAAFTQAIPVVVPPERD
jgi:small-conductance mechanosensitive channel